MCYANLGSVFQSLGQYYKAKEYLQKALVIKSEIGDRKGEGSCCANLGTVFQSLGQYDKAKDSKKRLSSQLKLATEKEKEHVMET